MMLECHEVENLLAPDTIMRLRCALEYKHKQLLERLTSAEEDIFGKSSIWRYLDLKNGITTDSIKEMNYRGKEWLLEKLKDITADQGGLFIQGFGENILQ